jgi:nitrogenase-associated protein
MAHITYFTKPGCMTSAKQVDLLRQSGHDVEVHDLLAHPWLPEELIGYFGEMPVNLWFNPNSPRVKSGEIDPSSYSSTDALSLMLEDHLLIRRPLMESGGTRICGFDPAKVHAWVGLATPEEAIADSANFQTCSQTSSSQEPVKCP